MESTKDRLGQGFAGAGRGNRTPTELSPLRILSPLRLPISPSRLAIILAYRFANLADDARRRFRFLPQQVLFALSRVPMVKWSGAIETGP